ncbi:phosphoadenylyl-sulfate reductase [Polaromonas sp.]|uniref:phosphoadenylyl-sulfate reductase n=1 Tax=Polaromonas sp. TaxID=1869339 RepID=UPI002FC954B7
MSAISLYAKPSANFAQKLEASKALLRSAAAQYTPLTQASSLGAEDMVVSHLIAETGIASSIFVLDTRMLHAQTLALVGRLEERYGLHVDIYQPDPVAADSFVAEFGKDAMYRSLELRKGCCHIRKMEPLERALAGKKGWITGLRREQSSARAEVHDVEQQELVIKGEAVSRVKINPLADWTWGDVWHFIATNNVPYNPLHDEFYPSIGCAPCTRAVTLGEDFRSGRWWWEQESAKECGLHVAADGTHEAQEPAAFEPLSSIIPIKPIPA